MFQYREAQDGYASSLISLRINLRESATKDPAFYFGRVPF